MSYNLRLNRRKDYARMADEGTEEHKTESEPEVSDGEWEDLMIQLKEQEDRKASLDHAREAQKLKQKQELKEKLENLKELNDKSEENLQKTSKAKSTRSHSKSRTRLITPKDLRSFESVAQSVEKQLSKMGIKEEETESSDENSVNTSSDDSDDDSHEKQKKRKASKRGKLKSGKTAKVSSRVVNPQIWPQSELSLGYVSKNVPFEELTIEEFVAGYSAIILLDISRREKHARIEHLQSLMYLATLYEWPAVRSFHGAVLLEIERGRLSWGDSFLHLENRSLVGSAKKTAKPESKKSSNSSPVLFCRDYQKGSCTNSKDHFALLKGEKK